MIKECLQSVIEVYQRIHSNSITFRSGKKRLVELLSLRFFVALVYQVSYDKDGL